MGNLLCCCKTKESADNSDQYEDVPFGYSTSQPQRLNNKKEPQNRGQRKATKYPVVQQQPRRGTAAKPATSGRFNVVYSNNSYKHHRHVSRNAPKASKAPKCYACGGLDHTPDRCRYLTRLCFYCREEGHIERICPKRSRSKLGKRMHRNGIHPVSVQKHGMELHHVNRKRYNAASGPRKPAKKYVGGLPPGVRRKSWTPVGTVVTIRSIEDFADDDSLKKKSGCDDLVYLLLCCL